MAVKDQFILSDDNAEIKGTVLVADLTTNATVLGVPAKTVASITTKVATYKSFHEITKDKNNCTSIDRENKNVSKKDMIAELRVIAKQYYYDNPAATSTMLMDAGLRARKVTSSKKSSGDTSIDIPKVSNEPAKGHKIELECLNKADTKGKPAGITLIRVKSCLGVNVPAETEDFPTFQDFSKHPIVLTFKAADAGKDLALAVCYVKKDGTEGPCCDVIFTNVP